MYAQFMLTPQEEDEDGVRGVRLSKQIMQIAGDALKRNITNLGPLVLPISEQLKFFFNILARGAARGKVCVCVCACVCVCVCIHTHIFTYVYIYIYIYICVCVCIYIYISVYVCT